MTFGSNPPIFESKDIVCECVLVDDKGNVVADEACLEEDERSHLNWT
jgi:hypothetical protein